MDKDLILKQAKDELHLWLDQMNLDNIKETFSKIQHYEQFFNSLSKLSAPTIEKDSEDKPDTQSETKSLLDNKQSELLNNEQPTFKEAPKYRLERQLRGGYLAEISAYVPEGAIRQIEAEDGDYLHASPKGNGHYFYELAQKGTPVKTERREVKFGLVTKETEDLFTVKSSLMNGGQSIKINDILHSFLLQREDVKDFNIEDGDIVDLAYYENNPSTARIVWKHDTDEDEYVTPMKAGYYKSSPPTNETNIQQQLKGKKVLVLGCKPRKAIFKRAIEEYGGEFDFVDGLEGEERLERKIANADVVVILIAFIKHHASQFSVKTCKEHGVSYSIVDTLGVQSVINGAITPQVSMAS